MPDSREKYQDYKTKVTNVGGGCGWVDLEHKLEFTDDKGQIEPAKSANYRLQCPNGKIIDGKLDNNGRASHQGVGHGKVLVSYEPNIDDEIKQLQTEIKKELDDLVEIEKTETKALEKKYEESGFWGSRWLDIKSLGRGIVGFFSGLWDLLEGIGSALNEVGKFSAKYLLDPLNAPETFKEDIKKVKAIYKELARFVDEDLETYFLFAQDEKTWEIFTDFAEDYLTAQHYSEYVEGAGTAVPGLILTILTAGAGGAAVAGSAGTRIASFAGKISSKVSNLAKKLKLRRAKKKFKDGVDKKVATTVKQKPYAKHRPSYKKGQVEKTWENAKGPDGKVYDPNTKEKLKWDKSKPRNGQWDMGHKKRRLYKNLHKKYMDGKISKEQFLKQYQDSNNYRPQAVNTNRSRRYD